MALRVGARPAFGRAADAATAPELAESCPEIACLRGKLPDRILDEAVQRAANVGVGADRVLIANGKIDEEGYLRALADAAGLTFDSLDGITRAQCPIDDRRLLEAAAAGLLPFTVGGGLYLVVAPRGLAARRILELIADKPALSRRLRLTSAARLAAFVFRHGADAIAARAADELKQTRPHLSAAPPRWRGGIVPVGIVGAVALAAMLLAPAAVTLASGILLTTLFLAWIGLRLVGLLIEWRRSEPSPRQREYDLPIYSIICALYREAASVDGLVAALERLDYPGIMAQTPQDLNPLPA